MNFKTLLIVLFISISVNSVIAQDDGYWDKERSFSKEIVVSAGERVIVKSINLPIGTTEVVFRVTVLDDNQQLANSLVSLLKSIPDPTSISQGTAGAVFLFSKISGEDKCRYVVFSSETLATEYKNNGNTDKACFKQNIPITIDANRLSIDESLCILPNSNTIWFGFESKNWLMSQKVVLEVIPWVNKRLNRGWTLVNRKTILEECKTTESAKFIINSDDFCVCVLDKVKNEYKFQEFQKLMAIEKRKAYADFSDACFSEMASSKTVYDSLRMEASKLLNNGKYGEAIDKLLGIVINGMATDMDFNTIGHSYIMTKQFGKAIKYLKDGEKMNDYELLIKLNLAHAYMFKNDHKHAKAIYIKYKSENVTNNLTWPQKVINDLTTFEKAGLPTDDFKWVLRLVD